MIRHRVPARACALIGLCLTLVLGAVTRAKADSVFNVINLVTDDQSVNPAQLTDPSLVNAWGISASGGSPFWVSDHGTGVATLYRVGGGLQVSKAIIGNPPDPSGGVVIPPPGSGNPTGQAFNSAVGTGAFNSNVFLFVSEDGTISGWKNVPSGTTAATVLQTASPDNVYKGTALDTTGGHSYLLSANFRAGTIDVLKGDSGAPNLTGRFLDPNLPSGYAPFNIAMLNGKIYVSYALQDTARHDDVAGAGHGFVSAFDLQGNFLGRIGTMGTLNSPWGMVIAPSSFGQFAGDLLVGNFGDGRISAFSSDPTSPGFVGLLMGSDGHPIDIPGFWGLIQGSDGGNEGSSRNIFFTAGPGDESHGLFGVITSVPEPSSAVLGLIALGVVAGSWQWKSRRRPRNS